MPGAFLYDNVAKGAVLNSAQATVPSMPLANLQDAQPRQRARLNAANATIDVDLLAALLVDCVALLSTTLSANATTRVRLANMSSFATVQADTATINAEAQDEAQGNVVLVLPAPVMARYLRIDLTDGAAPYLDIGLLVAGQLWRLQRGTAYGIREGIGIPSPVRNFQCRPSSTRALRLSPCRPCRSPRRAISIATYCVGLVRRGMRYGLRSLAIASPSAIAGPFGGRSMHRGKKPAPAETAFRSRRGRSGSWRG
jgi:hypothetical protein